MCIMPKTLATGLVLKRLSDNSLNSLYFFHNLVIIIKSIDCEII
jgi:hypothetical protein